MGNITPRDRGQFIGEQRWDMRHHVSPSQFNGTNHIFYKVSTQANFAKKLSFIYFLVFTSIVVHLKKEFAQHFMLLASR